jgi:hypothetical protein
MQECLTVTATFSILGLQVVRIFWTILCYFVTVR